MRCNFLKEQIRKNSMYSKVISLKCDTIIRSLAVKRARTIKLDLESTESCIITAPCIYLVSYLFSCLVIFFSYFLCIVLLSYRTQFSVNTFITKFIFKLGVYSVKNFQKLLNKRKATFVCNSLRDRVVTEAARDLFLFKK